MCAAPAQLLPIKPQFMVRPFTAGLALFFARVPTQNFTSLGYNRSLLEKMTDTYSSCWFQTFLTLYFFVGPCKNSNYQDLLLKDIEALL